MFADHTIEFAQIHQNLVGALEHEFYDFPYILGSSSSQLTNSIIFQRGRLKTPTRYSFFVANITMENHHVQWVNPLFLW